MEKAELQLQIVADSPVTLPGLVLVIFIAKWPAVLNNQSIDYINNFVKSFEERVKVVGIDIAQSPDLAKKFGVHDVPMVFLLADGVEIASKIGILSSAVKVIEDAIKKHRESILDKKPDV